MGKFDELYESIIGESINDKNKFKAVFLAGGPGSGKSFVVDQMFGGMSVPLLNSDSAFEMLLDKNHISKIIDEGDKATYEKQMVQRTKAKKMTKTREGFWLDGMLPIIIDGTGKDYAKIKKHKEQFEKLGYDTHMVFVNTTLDVALERNQMRDRKVDEKIVKNSWKEVQANLGKFQSLFRSNFLIVDNSTVLDKEGVRDLGSSIRKIATKFINSPLRNKTGIKAIDMLQATGGKYLSDLENLEMKDEN